MTYPFFTLIKPLNDAFQFCLRIYRILWDADTQQVAFSEAQSKSDAVIGLLRDP